MLRFQDSDEIPSMREVSSKTNSRKLPPLGRIFGILLAAEPRELDRGLSAIEIRPQQGFVCKAALALMQHVKDRNSSGLSLEPACVPILEHAVAAKESSYRQRSVILLRWLLQSKDVGVAVASALETVIGATPWNNRVRLGWCLLIRELVQGWSGQVAVDSPLHSKTLEIFVECIPQLANIVVVASVKESRRRVPTRLTIAAADCMLTITNTLAAGPRANPNISQEQIVGQKRSLIMPLDSDMDYERSDWLDGDSNIGNGQSTSNSDLFSNTERRELALWEQLDLLISLVRELEEWNDWDRPLFTKGLQSIHWRLQSLAKCRESKNSLEGGGKPSVGASVLAAYWQHYGGLILTEDKKLSSHTEPILQHWLGALQYYSQTEESNIDEENTKTIEMRGNALTCLTLVLGRFDARRLGMTLQELGPELLKSMCDQLHVADDNIVDLAVTILRAILFKPSSTSGHSVGAAQMESVVPMLLDMLDTRDIASKAVVLLVAEYFAVNPESIEMEQLFSLLDSEESGHRGNALNVLTELLSICTRSVDMTIAKHLFKRLGDIELSNRVEASALFAKLDPSFTLPALLEYVYSPDGRIRSAASTAVLSVLKCQMNQTKVVTEFLDCATNMVKFSLPRQDFQSSAADSRIRKSDGPMELDYIMRLIPDWAATVEDWESVIRVVVSKMFQEAANAVVPRFLSCISSQLANQVNILFPLILKEMRGQPKLSEDLLFKLSKEEPKATDGGALGRALFQRLSPLLVLRVLPLNAFNDHTCKELYGATSSLRTDDGVLDTRITECITSLLLERVCGGFEFEDVRKVASELTGRLLPNIMIPLVTAELEDACSRQDLIRLKACIYVFCTTLGVRRQESLSHPFMTHICQLLTSILLWQWSENEKGYAEVGNIQHGCIDFFALMICAELQPHGATQYLKESPAEFPAQRTERDTVDVVRPKEVVETSPLPQKIMLIEELPESEQIKEIEEKRFVDQFFPEGQRQTVLSANMRYPKLIEELPDSETISETDSKGEEPTSSQPAILSAVIACLIGEQERLPWCPAVTTVPKPFRVCMANVLISTCQKVALTARTKLASRMILPLVNFVQISTDSNLRGACLQVLFTAVYHLKASSVLPYAVDLFGLSIAAIKSKGLPEERIGGAKLLASLLGSEEDLVRDLAPRLIDAKLALTSISAMDVSPELRMICEKLLACL